MSLEFDAVLLAAGRSRRMGRDKALLPLGDAGQALWARQWQLLADAGASHRWLSVRTDQTWVPPETLAQVVHDSTEESGPLDGVVAAWRRSEASHLMVLAVDLPRLPPAWFRGLRTKCRDGVGAVGRHAGNGFEPLAGIYPRSWLPTWETALRNGRTSLQFLLTRAAELHVLVVEPIVSEQVAWFKNVNSPADLGN